MLLTIGTAHITLNILFELAEFQNLFESKPQEFVVIRLSSEIYKENQKKVTNRQISSDFIDIQS